MKRLMAGAIGTLVLGIAAFAFVVVYLSVGQSRGEEWGGLDGPEPIWPSVLGFGSMWLMAAAGALVVALVMIALVREFVSGLPRRR